jgi:hypothetical protein
MGFLSTLLYILLGFYVFKWLLRLFAPKIMAFVLKRLHKKMNDSFAGFTENQGAAPQQEETARTEPPQKGGAPAGAEAGQQSRAHTRGPACAEAEK